MKILIDYTDLPQKIICHLEDEIVKNFVAAFKTTYKPNATIPILWMVIHKSGLLFCNTHKSRGLYKHIPKLDIDSIKINKNSQFTSLKLEILFNDFNEDDFIVTLPTDIDIVQLEYYLENQDIQVI